MTAGPTSGSPNPEPAPARRPYGRSPGASSDGRGREHGDRGAFLGRIRARQGPPPTIGPHPPPPPPATVPEVGYRALDGVEDLERVFVDAAGRVSATVHTEPLADALAAVIATHAVRTAVVSGESEVTEVRDLLAGCGVEIIDAVADADLGVTSAVAGIAVTGSVVVDADVAGGRGFSLLPPVHLCVLDRARIVATPSDVFRRGSRPLPSNRVVITGPSRTGDIEQIITLGAHGPVAVHVVLV